MKSFDIVPESEGETTYNALDSILKRINNPNQTHMFNPQGQVGTNKLISRD